MTSTRFILSKFKTESRLIDFVVYDLKDKCVVHEISDYLQHMGDDSHLSGLTIEHGAQHLIEFWAFLEKKSCRLNAINNDIVREFRDANYAKVKASKAHRGSDDNAKVTVNQKLRRIYDWLIWLQRKNYLPIGTVGRHGLVSAIFDANEGQKPLRRSRQRGSTANYPLLFRTRVTNARHHAPGSAVSDEHVSQVCAHFHEAHDSFVAHRNILFVDIADSAGMRRGSICSLRVDQFSIDALHKARGEFLVRPARQKFGYTKTFGIDLSLAFRIRGFIDDYWLPWIEAKGIPLSMHGGALFVSAKTGRPITERHMTQAVSAVFRTLGFPKGIGPHTLRGKFASTMADRELMERRELGLDTSNTSIAASLAMKLGHNDPTQFYRYAASSQARQARVARESKDAKFKALAAENEMLKKELAKAKDEKNRLG